MTDDVLWAEPLLGVGELLAQLHAYALRRTLAPSAAERFGRAYDDAAGASAVERAAFEALALLASACRRGLRDPAHPLVAPLVRIARARLEESLSARGMATPHLEQQ